MPSQAQTRQKEEALFIVLAENLTRIQGLDRMNCLVLQHLSNNVVLLTDAGGAALRHVVVCGWTVQPPTGPRHF